MKLRIRLGRIALIAMLAALVLPLAQQTASAEAHHRRAALLRMTNSSRDTNRVRSVDLARRMSEVAREHSLKMARTQDLFHTNDPAKAYLQGVNWSTWGENVGVTGGSVADVHHAFMNSDGHRANILNAGFRHVAIGAVRRDGILWVTVFFWG